MLVRELIETNVNIPYRIIIAHNTHTFKFNKEFYKNYETQAIKDFGLYDVKQWCWTDDESVLEIWI